MVKRAARKTGGGRTRWRANSSTLGPTNDSCAEVPKTVWKLDEVGRSLAAERRKKAEPTVKIEQSDRGPTDDRSVQRYDRRTHRADHGR
jgi:hypothetical protein